MPTLVGGWALCLEDRFARLLAPEIVSLGCVLSGSPSCLSLFSEPLRLLE